MEQGIADWLIAPEALADSATDGRRLAFVDLDRCDADSLIDTLPPFPVIGVGRADHPLAARLDALVESPISAQALVAGIRQAPHAAAVAVQLLRSIEGLESVAALPIESFAMALLQGSAEHGDWLSSRSAQAQMPPGDVVLARAGNRLTITIDRPHARNAIDRALRDAVYEGLAIAACDPGIEAVLLRAEGDAFCVGADLAEFGTTRDPATAHHLRSITLPAHRLARIGGRLTVHVQGACIGAGLEMAAFARRIVATPDAWFQLPEIGMGLLPGAGGCVSIPRRIGRQRTALLLLSGRRIGARTALEWGLVDAIMDDPAADQGGAYIG